MADKPKISVDVIFDSRDARDFANNFGTLLSKSARKWRDDVKEKTGEGAAAGLKLALASGKGGAAIREFVKTNIADVYSKFMKELRAGNFEEAEKLERILDARVRRFQKEADAIADAFKNMQDRQVRTFEEHADAFGDKVQKLQRGLFGGLGGFADLARSGGSAVQRFGREQQAKGLRARELAMAEGKDAKGAERMAQFGKVIANIGKAAVAFAAVAGAVILLVKLFADLESKMKDANKAMLGSAGAADFGFSHAELVGGRLTKQLDAMRDATMSLNENFMKFKVSAEQQQQVLAQLNAAGYSFRRMNDEIAKGEKFMKNFSDATALAITYSRNFGTDLGEISERMGSLAFEQGTGLRDIAEQFSVISREAILAGFVTKRFYSAVVEATSGMAFYGVRIDETTKLLKSFDSLLGEAVGTEAFKKLVGQYKDKGAQDRIRDLIIKDQDFAQQQFGKAFERQLSQLGREFETLGLSEKELRNLLRLPEVEMTARLQAMGLNPEQIQRFHGAGLVGQAARGDVGAMTRAMPFAGPGFDVAMASSATEVFGGRRVDEVLRSLSTGAAGAAELAALQEVTGKSLDELEQIGRLFTNAEGALRNLEKMQAKMSAGIALSDEDRKLQATYQDKLGLFIDEQTGKIMKGEFDTSRTLIEGSQIAIKDALGLVSETSSADLKNVEEQLTKDQEIATEISKNITGLNDIMEHSVVGILNNIYSVVRVIADLMPGRSAEQRRLDSIDRVKEERERVVAELKAAGTGSAAEDAKQRLAAIDASRRALESTSIESIKEKGGFRAAAAVASKDLEGSPAAARAQEKIARALGDLGTGTRSALGQRLSKEVGGFSALTSSDEEMSEVLKEQVREHLTEKGLLEDVTASVGGEKNFQSVLDSAARSFVQEGGGASGLQSFLDTLHMTAGSFTSQVSPEVKAQWAKEDEVAKQQLEELRKIADDMSSQTKLGFLDFLGLGKSVNDVILPAKGGRPLITDEQDTLFAMRPDGPIARGMGGARGRGGSVTVNIHGGNQKAIYDTIMRVLKQTGNA